MKVDRAISLALLAASMPLTWAYASGLQVRSRALPPQGGTTDSPFRLRCRRSLAMQNGWGMAVDENGVSYYYNDQTGQAQWEPPGQAYDTNQPLGSRVTWWLAPAEGVLHEYQVCNGEEQILGRWDMVEPSPYVSRVQCLVQVAADGTCHVTSLGKPQTYILKTEGWRSTVVLRKGQTHALKHGEQIALHKNHRSGQMLGVFTVYAQPDGYDPLQAQGSSMYVQALRDYLHPESGQLGFRAGDVIEVTQQGSPDDWWEGSLNGQRGWFPSPWCSVPFVAGQQPSA